MKKKKYDFIVGIGRDCSCSMYLRKNNLQKESYPFDWLTNDVSLAGCLDGRFDLILNNFKDFINIEELQFLPKDPKIFNDKNCYYYENIKNNLYFYHDFPIGIELEEALPKIKEKYTRRIKRFYKSIKDNEKVLFVWFAHQKNISDKKIIEYSEKINEKFNKKIDIVLFENNITYPIKDKFDTIELTNCITKHILNTYPDCVKDKVRGNTKLCNKVFRLYSLNESFNEICSRKFNKIAKKLKKNLVKLICLFIPVKSWRSRIKGRELTKKLHLSKAILKLPFAPKIINPEDTITTLLDHNKSICRFGDGEFSLIHGNDIPFQQTSPQLSKRLKEILQSNDKNIAIAINYYLWNYVKSPYKIVEKFYHSWASSNLQKLTALLNLNDTYYSSDFSPFDNHNAKKEYEKIKHIWKEKDITIICGETIFDKIKFNIFDCSKSIDFIYAHSKNAFNDYNNLLEKAKEIHKNRMVLIILGPTATVLAYDMAKLGYRALDIGHIPKGYDWHLKEVKHNNKTIQEFFDPN